MEKVKEFRGKLWEYIKNNKVALKDLLKALEPYFTSNKDLYRLRATKILSKAIHHQHELNWSLNDSELLFLMKFFSDMTTEQIIGGAALKAILRIAAKLSEIKEDIYNELVKILKNINLALQAETIRKNILHLYILLYEKANSLVNKNSEEYLVNWQRSMRIENKHENCKIILKHTLTLLKNFPEKVISKQAAELFKALAVYFPVRISKPNSEKERKVINDLLVSCLTATLLFANYFIPFLIDKLTSIAVDTIIDVILALLSAVHEFPVESYKEHLKSLNDSLCKLTNECINPEVIKLTLQLQTTIWKVSSEYVDELVRSVNQYLTTVQGKVEAQGKILIIHAIEGDHTLCKAVFKHVALQRINTFLSIHDIANKSLYLKDTTSILYNCLQLLIPDYIDLIETNASILEALCKEVLKSSKEYDQVDVIVMVYLNLIINFKINRYDEDLFKAALNSFIEIVTSGLMETETVKEIAILSFKLIPGEVFEKSLELKNYIEETFTVIEQDISKKQMEFNILVACCNSERIFIRLTDLMMQSLIVNFSLPNLSCNQIEWLLCIIESFEDIMISRKESESTVSVLMKWTELFPIGIAYSKHKKLAKVFFPIKP